MDNYTVIYETLINLHVSQGKESLYQLSSKEKKILVLNYIKKLSYIGKGEIMDEVYELIHMDLPSLLLEILGNENDRFDPVSEMSDEMIRTLIEVVSNDIDEDFEEAVYNEIKKAFSDKEDLWSQDYSQRFRDMKGL